MNIDDLTIREARAISEMFGNQPNSTTHPKLCSGELCIVIADRGWVWAGYALQDGDVITIKDARCVRRWGTDNGLAQLAKAGPQKDTKLELPTTVRLLASSIVGIIPCEASQWT